jgi:hypothetical protein
MSDPTEARQRAARYRKLAEAADDRTASNLRMLAAAFELEADETEARAAREGDAAAPEVRDSRSRPGPESR